MNVYSCHLLFDHFQFALIYEPNIPGSYAILLFTSSDFTSIINHIHHWVLSCFVFISSFFLKLFLHWSPVAYGTPTSMEISSFSAFFAFSYCSWDYQGKNTEVICYSLLQWTTFCHNSLPWPIHLGWPFTAWLIVSLSYRRLWSMWSVWLVFCDCDFHSVCPPKDKDKRLMEASWWERLIEGKTGPCPDGLGHAQ